MGYAGVLGESSVGLPGTRSGDETMYRSGAPQRNHDVARRLDADRHGWPLLPFAKGFDPELSRGRSTR